MTHDSYMGFFWLVFLLFYINVNRSYVQIVNYLDIRYALTHTYMFLNVIMLEGMLPSVSIHL